LHVAQPKKRDNVDRAIIVPQTVLDGVKKTGPTIKELQEEFGGAGVYYTPTEEHYMLENDDWKYDKFPEFYNGKNVLDFYDKDIEAKVIALEKEEDELLKIETAEDEMWAEKNAFSENSDDVDMEMLETSLKSVRGKKAILKERHKIKSGLGGKLQVKPKNMKLSEIAEKMQAKGFDVTKDALRSRSKSRRTLGDLEEAQDKLAKVALDLSSDDDVIEDDKELATQEQKDRIANKMKRRREKSIDPKDYASDDEKMDGGDKQSQGRSLTTAKERKISVTKMIRSKSVGRREGSVPPRLPYKIVTEKSIALAKKINKRVFKHSVNISESDRVIQC